LCVYLQWSKYTTRERYNSRLLRKQLLAGTMGGLKCTNHSRPLWLKWCHAIRWPYSLKNTSSKQSKHHNLHPKWLHHETNNNTLLISIWSIMSLYLSQFSVRFSSFNIIYIQLHSSPSKWPCSSQMAWYMWLRYKFSFWFSLCRNWRFKTLRLYILLKV